MIESIVNLGPNFPVNARPSLLRVEMWITKTFSFFAYPKSSWIWSSIPLLRSFFYIFRAKTNNLHFFFSKVVIKVLLHSCTPPTMSFLYFWGLLTLLMACLYANLLISLRTWSSKSAEGAWSTHSLNTMLL